MLRSAAVLVVLCASALAAPAPAGAVAPGVNGRIAFTSGRSDGDAQARLYLRSTIGPFGAGSLSAPISPLGGQARHPSWSPDRTKIVYAHGTPGSPTTEHYNIFVIDLITGAVTALDGPSFLDGLSSDHPAWSPDGTKIAFDHQPTAGSAQRDIMVKTVGSSAPAEVLPNGSSLNGKPAWSPGSLAIYYHRRSAIGDLDIVRQSLSGGPFSPVAAATGIDEYQPSISPDGARVCFTLQPKNDPSKSDVAVASVLGGFPDVVSDSTTTGDINCTWSPDGKKLAYVQGIFSQGELMTVDADGLGPAPLSLEQDPGANDFDGNPEWAPDARPECPDSAVTAVAGQPVTLSLDCVDTGPEYERTPVKEGITNDGGPANGTLGDLTVGDPSTMTYTPNATFTGTDSVQFVGFDDFGFGTDFGRVTITVTPAPAVIVAPPVAPPATTSPLGAAGSTPTVLGPQRGTVFPAKLEVTRATVRRAARRLSVLAPITARASGKVGVRFQAGGRTSTFSAPVDAGGRVRVERRITARQARSSTGIVTLSYPGDADTQPQVVRLRAASRPAGMRPGRPRIVGNRLVAEGRMSPRARGVVRLQMLFDPLGQPTRTQSFSAPVVNGSYRIDARLTTAAIADIGDRRGVVHSYTLFTGYRPAGMRGEMASFEVLPAR